MAAHEQNLTLLDDEPLIDFCRLFECQVARTPNAIAIFFEDDAFTYDQLNAAANRIAHHLLSLNTTPEQRIGICLDRSFDAVATMLGILKAGCAFVPLDPEFPIDRLKYIIEDADIFHIVSDTSYGSSFEDIPSNPTVWNVDEMTARSFNQSHPHRDIAPNNLAYIMYTSGSTGKPKGVQIEHRSLATYCYADIEVYQIDNRDRTLQFSTLNFDIAIEEIFPPLLTGGSVCIRPRTRCHASNELVHDRGSLRSNGDSPGDGLLARVGRPHDRNGWERPDFPATRGGYGGEGFRGTLPPMEFDMYARRLVVQRLRTD